MFRTNFANTKKKLFYSLVGSEEEISIKKILKLKSSKVSCQF